MAYKGEWHESEFVFTRTDGRPHGVDVVSQRFNRLVRRAELLRIRSRSCDIPMRPFSSLPAFHLTSSQCVSATEALPLRCSGTHTCFRSNRRKLSRHSQRRCWRVGNLPSRRPSMPENRDVALRRRGADECCQTITEGAPPIQVSRLHETEARPLRRSRNVAPPPRMNNE